MESRLTKSIVYTDQVLSHPADGLVCEQQLGAIYSPAQTTFRVWAPTATRLTLNLYQSPFGGIAEKMALSSNPDGSWESTVAGDQAGMFYTYIAEGKDHRFNPSRELLDPYAQAVTGHAGRSIVVSDKTPVADRPSFPAADAIIYEMHLRDYTIDPDSGIQRRGRYLGLTEEGTSLTGRLDILTGIDHLTDLGVNVVQLMPLGEFHNNAAEDLYGWGYDAIHHFSPAGWYATERNDARRVGELKRMINSLHERGIRVTLDMVLNHTFELIDRNLVYSFEGLVPGYYYRLKRDGSYWDGSGCGNEFRTEAPMARHYLLACLTHWITEYKVDGFRLDLLGLIDLETMLLLVDRIRAIDQHIMLYGEPWAGGVSPIELTSKGKQWGRGWAVFNDDFRDALKGKVFDGRAMGFIQNGSNGAEVKTGIRGSVESFAAAPLETINYVECHDNHTLWDRILISTLADPTVSDADRRAMHKLAAVVLLTSQGLPFIHSGQEWLRTKGGNQNSYNKPDSVNMIRWRQKAENHDVFTYYRSLIEMRQRHRLFRYRTANGVTSAVKFLDDQLGLKVPPNCIAYQIEDIRGSDEWSRVLILLNPTSERVDFAIPEGTWRIVGDGNQVACVPLAMSSGDVRQGTADVASRSALILAEYRADLNGADQVQDDPEDSDLAV